jgi:hypothetical protein
MCARPRVTLLASAVLAVPALWSQPPDAPTHPDGRTPVASLQPANAASASQDKPEGRRIEPGDYRLQPAVCLQHPAEQGARITWCVDRIEVKAETMVVHLRRELGSGSPVGFVYGSDQGNRNMYLLDDQGRRYDSLDTGGAARTGGSLEPGGRLDGTFTFPAPQAGATSFVFVDDPNHLRLEGLRPETLDRLHHEAIDCLLARRRPVLLADLAGSPPARAFVYFIYKEVMAAPHLVPMVEMEIADGGLRVALPRPRKGVQTLTYWIEVVGTDFTEWETPRYSAKVVGSARECGRGRRLAEVGEGPLPLIYFWCSGCMPYVPLGGLRDHGIDTKAK